MKKLLFALVLLITAYSGYAQCTAAFSTTMFPVNNQLLNVAMNNTSTYGSLPPGRRVHFSMSWGDGSIDTPQVSVDHIYANTGKYIGTLRMWITDSATSSIYCRDSVSDTINVWYTPCATSQSYTIDPANSLKVNVTANTPAGTAGVSYTWNWGDGTPDGSGATASHTYTSSGIKHIGLSSTNFCSHYNFFDVTLVTTRCNGLAAGFIDTPAGLVVKFLNTSTSASGKSRTSFWKFGDGKTAIEDTPSHAYSYYGTYRVTQVTQWVDTVGGTIYCTDSFSKNITVGPGSVTNEISGIILQDSASAIASPQYKVWLIVYDSATTTLTAVDSALITGYPTGNWTPYQFLNKTAGVYRTKAKLLNGPTSGAGAVPTYYDQSLTWNAALQIIHSAGLSTGNNITMRYGTVTSGPGFVGGNVSAGANKGTSTGIPDLTMLLLSSTGQLIKSTITDANGDYSFGTLPAAAYQVYPEDAGFATTPAMVTISGGSSNITNIDFSRSASRKTITPVSTSVNDMDMPLALAIYPNPAKDKVTINWNIVYTSGVNITITDITGKKVLDPVFTHDSKTELSVKNLQKGLYLVTIEANGQKQVQKLLVQ